jgi:hypothetical protein
MVERLRSTDGAKRATAKARQNFSLRTQAIDCEDKAFIFLPEYYILPR